MQNGHVAVKHELLFLDLLIVMPELGSKLD